MPDQVRFIQHKETRYDAYVAELVSAKGYGKERHYAGISDRDQAESVRKALRQAGRHVGVSVKSYWEPCPNPGRCPAGKECRWHVRYSAYRQEDARAYKERISRRARGN